MQRHTQTLPFLIFITCYLLHVDLPLSDLCPYNIFIQVHTQTLNFLSDWNKINQSQAALTCKCNTGVVWYCVVLCKVLPQASLMQ